MGDPDFLGIRFSDFVDPLAAGWSVMQFGVYDRDTGNLIGVSIQLGDLPVMMLPVVPIPPGAIRFDKDRPRTGDG